MPHKLVTFVNMYRVACDDDAICHHMFRRIERPRWRPEILVELFSGTVDEYVK